MFITSVKILKNRTMIDREQFISGYQLENGILRLDVLGSSSELVHEFLTNYGLYEIQFYCVDDYFGSVENARILRMEFLDETIYNYHVIRFKFQTNSPLHYNRGERNKYFVRKSIIAEMDWFQYGF